MSMRMGEIMRGVARARYANLLNSFEWRSFTQQMKRAKGGRCELCRARANLNTHHNYYDSQRLPWEYDAGEVRVLCNSCHQAFEAALKDFRKRGASLLTPAQLSRITEAIIDERAKGHPLRQI